MTNPFRKPEPDQEEWVLVKDSPDRRVLLECGTCFLDVYEGKYYFEKKELVFECPCGHVTAAGMEL